MHSYAKALHYKEMEFTQSPSSCIEALISINNQLEQPEAAVGILKYAEQHHGDDGKVIEVRARRGRGICSLSLSIYLSS